jgi:PilZ domain
MRSLAYVRLDEQNGGIIRDLTDSGIAVQAVAHLRPGDEFPLRFDLFSPRVRIETRGRVAWSDETGQAGVTFQGLNPRLRSAVRDWILAQMLTAAAMSGRDSMFAPLESQLVLSPGAREAILVPAPQSETATVTWGFLSLSARNFSVLVDSLVLLCAILLFSVSAIAFMGDIPPLPLAAALFFAAGSIFVAAYYLIFSEFLCGASPGRRLAIASSERGGEDLFATRFR